MSISDKSSENENNASKESSSLHDENLINKNSQYTSKISDNSTEIEDDLNNLLHKNNLETETNNFDDSKEEKTEKENEIPLEQKIRFYSLPIISILLILTIWFKLYTPIVMDEWNKGIIHVENSLNIRDPELSEKELEKGGDIIKAQNLIHPYHARVWHLLGKYYLAKKSWDSCIYAEKKAIELGSGGIVNQVEFMAADNLNLALQEILNLNSGLEGSLLAIKNAEVKGFDNFVIDKFKGMVYSKFKNQDSAIFYLKRFNNNVPDDGYALMKISENYIRKNDSINAKLYLEKAKEIEIGNPQIDSLIKKISLISVNR
jgi:hypothetical protein